MTGTFTHANMGGTIYLDTGTEAFAVYYSEKHKCTHIVLKSGMWPVTESVSEVKRIFQGETTNEPKQSEPSQRPDGAIPLRKTRKK